MFRKQLAEIDSPRGLAGIAVILAAVALIAFAANQHAVAGVLFLLVSFTIYRREKQM